MTAGHKKWLRFRFQTVQMTSLGYRSVTGFGECAMNLSASAAPAPWSSRRCGDGRS